MDPADLSQLFGFKIQSNIYMVGLKKAIRQGDTIHVSPAMYDLISNAEGDELGRLMGSIPLLTLPDFDIWNIDLSMPVSADAEKEFRRDLATQRRFY